jgi:hypothetical protein
MKKQLEFSQNLSLLMGTLLFLFSMVMAFNCQYDKSIMEDWLIVMFFSEVIVIGSCISIYANRDKK